MGTPRKDKPLCHVLFSNQLATTIAILDHTKRAHPTPTVTLEIGNDAPIGTHHDDSVLPRILQQKATFPSMPQMASALDPPVKLSIQRDRGMSGMVPRMCLNPYITSTSSHLCPVERASPPTLTPGNVNMTAPTPPTAYHLLSFEQIRVAHVPHSAPSPTPVILITLYRPRKHNAFTEKMRVELVSVLEMLSVDPRVKAIVVTGHGSMFCAGMDLNSGRASLDMPARDYRDGGGRLTLAIHRCTKPVIAAINGSAVGIGITMTLPMTIRIVSREAKIGFVFARRGLVMEAASSYFLPRLIGMSKALHLVTTGSVYPSTSPLFGDLFSEVVETKEVVPRALALADEIARNTSAVSTQLMKDMMYHGPSTAEEAHLLDSRVIYELFKGEDHREGVESFLNKRQAEFKGSLPDNAPEVWPWWPHVETETAESLRKAKL